MQPRKGHSRLRHPGDICTHTQIHESSYCNKTHTRTQTHGLWKNRPCILTVWVAYASRVFLFFLFLFVERVALGIRRGITGLILSQGCRLLPLKFPPPQMKVAVEVEDGMQVFQLLTSSKLFFSFLFFLICFPATASLRWQIPQFMSPRVASLLSWVLLCGLTNLRSFQQMDFEELLSVQ